MAGRRKQPTHENHDRWLVSYADFITLLFAFFVVMFASSQTDKGRAAQVSESVAKALNDGGVSNAAAAIAKVLGGTVDDKGQGNAQMKGPGGAKKADKPLPEHVVELVPSMKALSRDLEEEIKAGKVEVNLEPRGLVVSLRESAFFPSGEAVVETKSFPTLGKLAKVLLGVPNPVHLEGHTDSIPIHNERFRSNWELSSARGIAMLETLSTRFGLQRERLAVVGYADTTPVDSNDTVEGRARNRRVDVVIMSRLAVQGSAKASRPRPAVSPK
ncbi:MAG: OmpA family protein [Acidobacteria bacterium]|nr:OmpA family protein [Acidobacteriota bacterium]MBI3472008.1 OmpA family protein [Candidatus Solibacter usitatus]